jgi:hypothetical protein
MKRMVNHTRYPATSKTRLFRRDVPLIAVVAILTGGCVLPAQDLSKEGQQQKAIHDYLFETFLEGRKTVDTGTGRDRGLKELTILQETREIRHGDELMLPAGAERIAGMFRHFGFHGADLDQIAEVRVFPFSPDMGGRQIAIDLSGVAKRIGASGATQTRLNYHKGEVVFEPEHTVDAAAIPVDVNETTVIRLAVDKPFAPSKTLQLDRWYATDTAVKSDGTPVSFEVNVHNSDAVQSVRLIVGVHRRGGVTEPLAIDMNGTPITVDTGDANEFTEFFAPLDAVVPTSLLRDSNKIVITAQNGTTITSVQLVTHRAID